MNTYSENMPNDPGDQEQELTSFPPKKTEMDQQGADLSQNQTDDREAAPTDEDLTDHFRSAQTDQVLIPVLKEKKAKPGEEDEEEDDVDDEPDEEEENLNQKDDSSDRGKDTTMENPGDVYPSPANNPYETNFEDPAQNRKTDPMTDHEQRISGI